MSLPVTQGFFDFDQVPHDDLVLHNDDFEWFHDDTSCSDLTPSQGSDETPSSCASGAGDESDRTVVKKKHRKRYVVNLFPRVVKSDIRRYYGRMITNVCNSFDPALMKSFMSTYCVPHFSSVDKLPTELVSQLPNIQSSYTSEGLDAATALFVCQFELMPDTSALLRGSSIKQFLDDNSRSELTVYVEFMGTKLYHIEPQAAKPDNYNKIERMAGELDGFLDLLRLLPTSTTDLTMPPIDSTVPCVGIPSLNKRLSAKPFSLRSLCRLQITLDANNRMSRMESSYSYLNDESF